MLLTSSHSVDGLWLEGLLVMDDLQPMLTEVSDRRMRLEDMKVNKILL